MTLYTAFYDVDTNCVNAWLTDRSIVTIDCQKVEDAFADNMYERSELDYLLFNDPAAYADLVLNEAEIPDSKAHFRGQIGTVSRSFRHIITGKRTLHHGVRNS